MTIFYECLGVDEYNQTLNLLDPLQRGNYYNNGEVFRDYWTWNSGMLYTPESLSVPTPYPDRYVDADGITYRKVDRAELDNHAFEQSGRQGPLLNTPNITGDTFVPQVVEKDQPKDNSGYEMGNTWHMLKERGLLK